MCRQGADSEIAKQHSQPHGRAEDYRKTNRCEVGQSPFVVVIALRRPYQRVYGPCGGLPGGGDPLRICSIPSIGSQAGKSRLWP